MTDATSNEGLARPDLAADRLAERIDRLPEPYRSNAIEWLEGWAKMEISDPDRDLSKLFKGSPAIATPVWADLLGDVLEEAVRYFGVE